MCLLVSRQFLKFLPVYLPVHDHNFGIMVVYRSFFDPFSLKNKTRVSEISTQNPKITPNFLKIVPKNQ